MQTRRLARSAAQGQAAETDGAAAAPSSPCSPPAPTASAPTPENDALFSQQSSEALFRQLMTYRALNEQLIQNLAQMVTLNGRLAERLFKLETSQASIAHVGLLPSSCPPRFHPWVSLACEQDDPRVYTPEVDEMDYFPPLSPGTTTTTTEECETVACTPNSDSDESLF